MSIPSPAPRRNRVVLVIDIVATVVLLTFGIVFALAVLTYATVFGSFTAGCGTGPSEGLTCNTTALGIAVYGLIVVTVLATLLAIGMVIVSLIRRRPTFWWPLGSLVITVVAFYLASWLAGSTVPA